MILSKLFRKKKKPHYLHLKDKWSKRHEETVQKIITNHAESLNWLSNTKQIALGSLGGLLLLSAPPTPLKLPATELALAAPQRDYIEIDNKTSLITALFEKLPKEVKPLTSEEERQVTQILSEKFGLVVTAELKGKRLERNYGLIGAEQHLMRFTGDSMSSHFDTQEEANLYYSSGMAPGRGAWGYFVPPYSQMTEKDKMREKYYIAVQTFLSKDFNKRFAEYRDFYKFRKMLLVNPYTGRAVVAVIGDAGPAVWTGKHLGGSPEVMYRLERQDGAKKGPVLFFFIDDPKDKVKLGPVDI
ncbi:hypothetical protein C4577_00160 [Candidatus Parcubacteria bacterium]|nr:MAG: hypothetical protein C4577_00160 [Candidatus Parcubacteria bacterium]